MNKNIALIIGILIIIAGFFITTPLAPVTFQLICIFASAIWLWVTHSIEMGSIVALTALCLVPGITTGAIITAAFGNTTIWFLIFSMILTYALSSSGVLRRIAIYFVDNPAAKKNSYWFMAFYFLAILLLGSFMAPTVTFVLFFGLVKEIYDLLKLRPGDKMARNLMIGTGFFASISCAMTPIAHTFPLMALGYYEAATGVAISYFAFMQLSIPICLLIAIAAYLLLVRGIDKKFDFNSLHFERTNWTWQEIVALIVFIGVVICWLVVGIWPTTFVALNALGTIWPALIGIIILMACGILNIKEACSKGVAWPAILLCGTTLALGKYVAATEYGIIPLISSLFVNVNPASILFIIVAFTIILTNLISNIVTTTLSYNLFVPMIMASGMVSPVIATILIGICASLAYALPSSIAHIALAGSSGWATANDMIKYGIILGIISIIIIGVIILL